MINRAIQFEIPTSIEEINKEGGWKNVDYMGVLDMVSYYKRTSDKIIDVTFKVSTGKMVSYALCYFWEEKDNDN